jgi:uracil-DNA glycosylase
VGELGYHSYSFHIGVFLLNGVLTVEAKKSNSHKDCGWTQFTDEVIRVID